MEVKKLPIRIESFKEIVDEKYYYIDKTRLISDLLNDMRKVNLFVPPRRFGKTLNMSMLQFFFNIGTDKSIFDGLAISDENELCEQYMGKYPVVFGLLSSLGG